MNKMKTEKTYKPWITEVEREVDEIRETLQERAEKIGWDAYWKESWKKTQKDFGTERQILHT